MCSSNRQRSERGNAALEFAVAFAMLWALFSGVFQYGYSFYVYNRLMQAVSSAAALGSKISYDTANPGAFTSKMQNMVMYGSETAGTSALFGLSTSQVNVRVTTTGSSSIPTDLTITIGSAATPFVIDAFFGKISLTGKPRATAKYFGQVQCSTC